MSHEVVSLRNTIFLTISLPRTTSVGDAMDMLLPDRNDESVCRVFGLAPGATFPHKVGPAPVGVWSDVNIEGLTQDDWRDDVASGLTVLGYHEWFAGAFGWFAEDLLSGESCS
jgi:hypothetical protein